MSEQVNHPSHYGGKDNVYEAIKIIRALDFGFNIGNCFKYLARAGKKNPEKLIEDYEKALWYLQDEIEYLKKQQAIFDAKASEVPQNLVPTPDDDLPF